MAVKAKLPYMKTVLKKKNQILTLQAYFKMSVLKGFSFLFFFYKFIS